MKRAAVLLLFASLLGCQGGPGEEPAASASPRRVFLITVDTLRADHMSLYGYPRETSPRLAQLAAGGVTFDRAIAQWPKTGSSFASIFTGLYPHTTGLTHKAALRIPEEYTTLPELFQESGFTTLAVQSNAVLASRFGWNDGFDEYLETWGGGDFPQNPKEFRPLAHATKVNELALPLLRRHKDAERLFVWLHYSDPHAPYMLPPGEANPFLDDDAFRAAAERTVPRRVTRGYTLDGRDDLKYYVAQYDANVRVADAAIQRVLDEARALGLLEDSLIVFTADHGESLGEHNSWFEHGPLPYNTTAHVPLFFVRDGLPAGRRVGRPVELVDLYPTLLDLVFPKKKISGLEGQTLLPFLEAGAGAGPKAGFDGFVQAFSSAGRRPDLYNSVQEGTWKLVYNSGGKRSRAASSPTGGFELYDLNQDPLETNNLAASRTEELRRLRRDLMAWMKTARAMGDEEDVDAEAEKALRALGYTN
jgi:arylsulfatase A-like enzyme